MIYETRNSIYEVDEQNQRARYVSGKNGPTGHFSPAGEWKTFKGFSKRWFGDSLFFEWDQGRVTVTSPVLEVRDE